MFKICKNQQKILLTILGGIALNTSRSPQQYCDVFRSISRDWRKIAKRNFNRSLSDLSKKKLIQEQKLRDGSYRLMLTKEGKRIAEKLQLFGTIATCKNPRKWDGKWRLVLFYIPEIDRIFRDILRRHLRTLSFAQLQRNIFVTPHPYEKQIIDLVRVYNATRYVHVITATTIDDDATFKKHFFTKK